MSSWTVQHCGSTDRPSLPGSFIFAPGLLLYFQREFYVRLVASGDLVRQQITLLLRSRATSGVNVLVALEPSALYTAGFFSTPHGPQLPRPGRGADLLLSGGTHSPSSQILTVTLKMSIHSSSKAD